MSYTTHSVNLTEGQKTKLKRAVNKSAPVSLKLSHASLNGSHPLPLTATQINHIKKSMDKGAGYVVNLSQAQVKQVVSGGFLPMLGIALLGGIASALGGFATNKILDKVTGKGYMGNGYGADYIQNISAVGKGGKKKRVVKGRAISEGFTGQGLFQYGQPAVRASIQANPTGRGMVPL